VTADAPHPHRDRPLRSFVLRAGRVGPGQARALAELERMLRALDAYQNVAAVRDEPAPEGGVGTASVTRQDVESSPAAPAPAAPVSGGGS
jgi:hypothetical protein